jgi:hypothetical protein
MITNLAKDQYDVADIITDVELCEHSEDFNPERYESLSFETLFINELPRLQAKFPGMDNELLRYMLHEEIDGELIDCFIKPTENSDGTFSRKITKLPPKRTNFGDPKNIPSEMLRELRLVDEED